MTSTPVASPVGETLSDERLALEGIIRAWEATKPGDTTVREIQRWIIEDMKPAVDMARAALSRRSLGEAESGGEAVDDLAAVLWRTEATDAGVPQSVIDGRTRSAFDDESDSTKDRWRKFARAAIAALQPKGE